MIPYLQAIIVTLDSIAKAKNKGDKESLVIANQQYRDAMTAWANYLDNK